MLALTILAGCGSNDGGGRGWAVPDHPADEQVVMGEASVDGTVVTLGDGTAIDVGHPVDTFVVAGDGVYAVPGDGDADDDALAELVLATPDSVEGTGAHPDPDSLRTSPDGRYLGFVDYGEDPYGAPGAIVVVDLQEGTEVVHSSDDMDSSGDLEAVYADNEPGVFGVTDNRAYVKSISAVWSYSLPDGKQTKEAVRVEDVYDADWFVGLQDSQLTQFPHRADDEDG